MKVSPKTIRIKILNILDEIKYPKMEYLVLVITELNFIYIQI